MKICFFTLLFFSFLTSALFAQNNFVLVERKDVKEYDEIPVFNPDARISGDLKYSIDFLRGESLGNPKNSSQNYYLDYNIRLRSEINRKVSLNFSLTNTPDNIHHSNLGPFYPLNSAERKNFPKDVSSFGQVFFGEANIDYQFTPELHLKFGIQDLNLGDETGLIFKGRINAFSVNCGLGTWCFSGGIGKISPDDASSLEWFKIDYPIYDVGVQVKDLWNPGEQIRQDYMQFDFYGVVYNDRNLPLAKYGGFTWDASADNSYSPNSYQVFEGKRPVYYNTGAQYFGINYSVRYFGSAFRMNFVSLSASRHYFQKISNQTNDNSLNSNTLNGTAFNIEFDQVIKQSHKIGLQYFLASGQDTQDTLTDAQRRWLGDEEGYFEINKGTYGKAHTYFNGFGGHGLGHSVSNVTFISAFYSFRTLSAKLGVDLQGYVFSRTKPVRNELAKKVSEIGSEIDLGIRYYFEKDLLARAEFDLFFPGDAYAANDNDAPPALKKKAFSNIRLSIQYKF